MSARSTASEPSGFDQFCTAAAKRLVAAVRAAPGDLAKAEAEAEDAAREAYARAWQRRDRLTAADDPTPWAHTVAQRLAVSSWRHARNRVRAHVRHGPPADLPGLAPDRLLRRSTDRYTHAVSAERRGGEAVLPTRRSPDGSHDSDDFSKRFPVRSVRSLSILAVPSLAVALLAGCQSASDTASVDAKPARITVTPNGDAAAVAPDATVKVTAAHGTLTKVRITPDGAGTHAVTVTGSLSKAKSSWHSTRPMTPGTTYAVEATATNAAGKTATQHSTFRTRAAQQVNGVTVTPSSKSVVGVGQPVSLAFDHPVTDKAAVERQLSVSTSPRTEGSWGWVKDPLTGTERADWRPKTYWHKGTKVTLRARLSGVNTGDSRYLRRDVSSTFTIGTARVSKVDLQQHTMTVYEDGQKQKTIPISAGQPSYPTWNGTMVVLDKAPMVHMTSESVGIADPYSKDVPWAVHLTTSGTYAHAAPWNEGRGYFGRVNMSHGCVGMSSADGQWFYHRATRGDVVEVTGSTRATVSTGNGFGDWNLSYGAWQKLSALR